MSNLFEVSNTKARKCNNYTGTVKERGDISFHTLPKDGLLKEKWVKVIRKQRREDDWMPTNYATVCSEHFLSQDLYLTKGKIRRLKKTAVPVVTKEEQSRQEQNASPSSLKEVDESDDDSIDNPTIVYYKDKIEELALDKRITQLQNYNLTRKVKRLQERCKTLNQLVLKLQKQILFYRKSVHHIRTKKKTHHEAQVVENKDP